MNEDLIKKLAAVAALIVTLYSVFNAMTSPMLQRISDLEAEVVKRRTSMIEHRDHFHEHEQEMEHRVSVLETTEAK